MSTANARGGDGTLITPFLIGLASLALFVTTIVLAHLPRRLHRRNG
jgi:hypothetical protein